MALKREAAMLNMLVENLATIDAVPGDGATAGDDSRPRGPQESKGITNENETAQ
jgi:hypothetical protein